MDCAALVQRQRAFFVSGATRPVEFRQEQLRKLRDAIEANETRLLQALHTDLGKSSFQGYLTEIGITQSELRYALSHLPAWVRRRRRRSPIMAWPGRGFIQPEPYGVACIVGPWNYPFQLLISPLVGAVAAGNCAILKPSEFAPNTAAAIADLLGRTFPQEFLAVVQGGQEAAEALLREKFDFIFFTGSTAVGRAVMTAASRHLTPVALELGGKCPCIVCADAPLEVTARRIAWGKFMNAGQTCVAPDFLLVHKRVKAGLMEELKRAVRAFYGDDAQKHQEYGRIINQKHLQRLTSYLSSGQVAYGGQSDPNDLYLSPTIITDAPPDAPVMQEEIFGPILPIVEFTALDDALASLRNTPTPLALYLFTNDRTIQERVVRETRSGGVCLNDTILHMIGKDLPFGGLGESGMGAYHGQATFDCFSHQRSVLRRSFAVDPKLRYPPARISLETLKRSYRYLLGG